jgi:hypothetical protein
VRGVELVLPESTESALSDALFDEAMGPGLREDLRMRGIEQGHVLDYVLAMGLAFASLLGWMFVQRKLLRSLFAAPPWFYELAPLAALAILPGFFRNGTHFLYDFPALLLAASLCLALARRRLLAFHLLFAIALLNKETALCFVLLFALEARRWLPRPRLFACLAAQLGLFVVIRGAVALGFADNPGSSLEQHLHDTLAAWMVPPSWVATTAFFATLAVLFRRFRERPALLRAGVWLFPPFLALHLFFGYPGEIRVYYELVPLLFALGYASWAEWMGTRVESVADHREEGAALAG